VSSVHPTELGKLVVWQVWFYIDPCAAFLLHPRFGLHRPLTSEAIQKLDVENKAFVILAEKVLSNLSARLPIGFADEAREWAHRRHLFACEDRADVAWSAVVREARPKPSAVSHDHL